MVVDKSVEVFGFSVGRTGLIYLFFLFLFLFDYSKAEHNHNIYNDKVDYLIQIVREKKLYNSKVWHALIHYKNQSLSIKDRNFILSVENFSPENELIFTIRAFFSSPREGEIHPICRFPARFYWLRKTLDLGRDFFPDVECPEVDKFDKLAPSDDIYVVFVSENVIDPSSMMGHIFFKFSGKVEDNRYAEHSISFFAVINTTNLLLLGVEAFITGMEGIFSLSPYRKTILKYLYQEDRNMWEYRLNLSEDDKKILRYHIFELKYVSFRYYFISYNCATVVYEILRVIHNFDDDSSFKWLSPKEVVKVLYEKGFIEKTVLTPSINWKIRILNSYLNLPDIVYEKIFSDLDFSYVEKVSEKDRPVVVETANSLLTFLLVKNSITLEDYDKKKRELDRVKSDFAVLDFKLDINDRFNPINSPRESQLFVGYAHRFGKDYISLNILPTYSKLTDDNRNYLTETSLSMFEASLYFSMDRIILDYFKFIEYQQLLPRDRLVGGTSQKSSISLERHLGKSGKDYLSGNLTFGRGYTYSFMGGKVFFYGFLNLGLAYTSNNPYIYINPEIGLITYETDNMKSILTYNIFYNQVDSGNITHKIIIKHVIFSGNMNLNLFVDLYKVKEVSNLITNTVIGLSKYF